MRRRKSRAHVQLRCHQITACFLRRVLHWRGVPLDALEVVATSRIDAPRKPFFSPECHRDMTVVSVDALRLDGESSTDLICGIDHEFREPSHPRDSQKAGSEDCARAWGRPARPSLASRSLHARQLLRIKVAHSCDSGAASPSGLLLFATYGLAPFHQCVYAARGDFVRRKG